MKSHLKIVSTKEMDSTAWIQYRKRGIGASEVGTILGLNPYKCAAQLFWEKLGETTDTVENMCMFMGKEMEDFIANLWSYWDPNEATEAAMMQNYRADRKLRKSRRVNAYVHNPEFPWLFVSLDRVINKTANGEGSLEIKTLGGWESGKWESGIVPSHVVQVQTQLLVTEFTFGELAVLKDGRQLDVYPFEENKGIQETIVTRTKEFWDRVERGRVLWNRKFEAERNFNYKLVSELEAELTTIEPGPEGTEAYAKYLKERYKIADPGEMRGNDELLTVAVKMTDLDKKIKELEAEKRLQENILKNSLRDGADKITFGDYGYISWKADSNKNRRLLNKVKSE